VALVGWALAAMLAAGCSPADEAPESAGTNASTLEPPNRPGLQAVSLPDLAAMEASVQQQLRERFASLRQLVGRSGVATQELSNGYGEMGKLLMAAEQLDAAEACLLNAQTLAPDDRRWPYYLGQLYKIRGPAEKSVASFERARELDPDNVATLVWLGEAYLVQGRSDAAAPLFGRALEVEPDSVAAHFGAGRAALAAKDYRGAVMHLEKALALDPRGSAARYPLAMAYRGLGDTARAEAHLRQQGDIRIMPTDPLMRDLDGLLQSARAYDLRGGQALETGDYAAAAAHFRRGLELAPADAALRLRLGTALFQLGDAQGAREQFEQVLRTTPGFSKAHYSLGVLLEGSGQLQEATDHFLAAVKSEPGYVQAHLALGRALRQGGRFEESLRQYQEALAIEPGLSDATFGYAMTLVAMKRYRDARETLANALKTNPDQPFVAHALARLLASAPDDRVRDGRRAMAMVKELLEQEQSIELGETLAMTLAELGDYAQAASVQRDVIAATERSGLGELARRMATNLQLYERRQPCRTPWRDGELP
jgi:tetratricopeptide (TPR) repeat protein